MTPAFRLRLPCIPIVPAFDGSSLVAHCDLLTPPTPQVNPPPPLPPPPSQGCYEITVKGQLQLSDTFGLEVTREYPKEPETGVCQPVFNIILKVPGGGPGGKSDQGGPSGSSGSSSSTIPLFGCETIDVLVDITCHSDDCTITKYFKTICYISCPCPDAGDFVDVINVVSGVIQF